MQREDIGWLEDSVETPREKAELRAVGGQTRHKILVYDRETDEQLAQYPLRPSIRNYGASVSLGLNYEQL